MLTYRRVPVLLSARLARTHRVSLRLREKAKAQTVESLDKMAVTQIRFEQTATDTCSCHQVMRHLAV
jgi:hypothetical protein